MNESQHPQTPRIIPASAEGIALAVQMLQRGELVAFPTETVYGLGADATQDKAVAAIYAAKGRPSINPLIVHVADRDALDAMVRMNKDADLLAMHFWPGSLTLVLPRQEGCAVSPLASAGLPSVAVRIPDHPVALDLLKALGRPIVAPSANRSGKLSPTTPMHVAQSLGGRVPLILAAGKTNVGVESTIISLVGPRPRLLRAGGIEAERIAAVLGMDILDLLADPIVGGRDQKESLLAPGLLEGHYAPNAQLRLNAMHVEDGEALLAFGPVVGPVVGMGKARLVLNLSETGDVNEAAAHLFTMLHAFDEAQCTHVAVMPIPEVGLGRAVNDRLRRAAIRF